MLIARSQAAKRLGVTIHKLLRWVDAGKIPAYRTPAGRWVFRPEDVDAYLAKPKPTPAKVKLLPGRRRGQCKSDTPYEPRIITAEEALAIWAKATPAERKNANDWLRHKLFLRRVRKGLHRLGEPTYWRPPTKPQGVPPPSAAPPIEQPQPQHVAAIPAPIDQGTVRMLMTKAEVAKRLGVTPRTIERWVAAGALRAYRLPGGHSRFRPEDVDACLGAPVPASKPPEGVKAPSAVATAVTIEDALKAVGADPSALKVSAEVRMRQMLAKKRRRSHEAAAGTGRARP